MGNLHRIQWIDRRIRSGQHPNCSAIAEKFEISKRQAARDIEYLRDSLGAPLIFSSGFNGYAYDDNSFRLPGPVLTGGDAAALHYLSDQYLHSSNQQAVRLAEIFRTLAEQDNGLALPGNKPLPSIASRHPAGSSAVAQDASVPVPSLDTPEYALYSRIEEALEVRKKIEITYVDAKNVTSCRSLQPYLLYHKGQTPYLAAYCELRRDLRVFQLSRIRRLEILRKGYIIPDDFDPAVYLTTSAVSPLCPYVAIIRFSGAARLAHYPYRHEKLADGSLSMDFHQSNEFLNWLLPHPAGFRILSPSWLRTKLKNRLQQLLADAADVSE